MNVTIYDIAKKSKVSIATVSRVLNNSASVSTKTRRRVLAVAEELGYQPHVSAQSLARRRTNLISAVIPMLPNYFYVEVLRGLQDRLADSEYDLLIYSARTPEEADGQLRGAMQRGRSAGVLLLSTPLTPERVTVLKRSGQPVVLVDSFHVEFDTVSIDNEQGGYLATKKFVNQGYNSIGLIMARSASVPALERRKGYERALLEAGIQIKEDLIIVSQDSGKHGFTEASGYRGMKTMLQRNPLPGAVFVTSDIQALGVLKAIREAELRVPDDIAVIGFDDIVISQYIGLSTLQQPMYEIGKLAVEKLLMRIQHPGHPTSHTVFVPRLVNRLTTIPDDVSVSVPA